MLLWKLTSFRLIRPVSSSRMSYCELLLYFHSIYPLPRIPFFLIACFILWVLENLLWIMLYSWFILRNIWFSTMCCRNCGTWFCDGIVHLLLLSCFVVESVKMLFETTGNKGFQGCAVSFSTEIPKAERVTTREELLNRLFRSVVNVIHEWRM